MKLRIICQAETQMCGSGNLDPTVQGYRQTVRHEVLVLICVGSNPTTLERRRGNYAES